MKTAADISFKRISRWKGYFSFIMLKFNPHSRESNRVSRSVRAVLYGALSLLLAASLTVGLCDYFIPDSLSFYSAEAKAVIYDDAAVFAEAHEPLFYSLELSSDQTEADSYVRTSQATAKLLGTVPVKTVELSLFDRISLTPGGMPFGVKFYTDGVIVVGMNDVSTGSGTANPAREAGIRVKDIIKKINGSAVNDVSDVTHAIEESGGAPIVFTVLRGSSPAETLEITVTPIYSESDHSYRTGLWVRSSTAGIGTVTFINESNCSFAGLGHGICDVDTGMLLPLGYGSVVDVTISGVNRGVTGSPGELQGYFTTGAKSGVLLGNCEAGVYGVLAELPKTLGNSEYSSPLPIALRDEVVEGDAYILCTVTDDNTVGKYSVKLSKLDRSAELKNFVVTVTDPELLSLTGGIVQGMSGSPIIQNGRIIGAVTHVLINDPTRGYGILIENMLKSMPDTVK